MFAFSVKKLQFLKNRLSFRENLFNVASVLSRFTVSSDFEGCFFKLEQLFAALFFNPQIFLDFKKKIVQFSGSQRPNNHWIMISVCGSPICNGPSKSFQKPLKDRKSCISYLQGSDVRSASSCSINIMGRDSEASLSINKTGEISQIFFGWIKGLFDFFHLSKVFFCDQISHMNFLFYLSYKFMSNVQSYLIYDETPTGFYHVPKQIHSITLCGFKNKEAFNFLTDQKSRFSFDCPYVALSSINSFVSSKIDKTPKYISKMIEYLFISGRYLNGVFKHQNAFRLLYSCSNTKTAISIYVSSQIRKLKFVHKEHITDKLINYQDPQRLSG